MNPIQNMLELNRQKFTKFVNITNSIKINSQKTTLKYYNYSNINKAYNSNNINK